MGDSPKTFFRVHAVQRMFERRISVRNVRQALERGETVEDYSAEMAQPGRLILGFQGRRPFHVVISEGPPAGETTVITAYMLDSDRWEKDSRTRRS